MKNKVVQIAIHIITWVLFLSLLTTLVPTSQKMNPVFSIMVPDLFFIFLLFQLFLSYPEVLYPKEISAVWNYMLKPIRFSRFEQAVIKTRDYLDYLKHINPENDHYLFIRSEYKLCKIAMSEIKYIEGLDNYVRIFTENSKPAVSHISLKGVSERLPRNMFLRVHRSFIINIKKDISYSNRYIRIGDKQIPVGISYEENVKRFFGLR